MAWWLFPLLAVPLALHKSHALFTPQLWAEDGSIFLMQAEQDGIRALLIPYMGYLHLFPRLIAWICTWSSDPAWWPAVYNWSAFAVWVGVIARTFSSRLEIPGKPWLAGALFLGPQTGEILFNITNVQWIAAFVLIQQALINRPNSPLQRYTDLALVVLVGLTGPFSIALLPLLGWRWWHDRHRDNLALLLACASCALIQAWFIVQTGPKFAYQAEAFHLGAFLSNTGRRLLVWPVLGTRFSLALPPALVGLMGWSLIIAVLTRACRPHPLRVHRLPICAGFILMLVAGMYRVRPDTWSVDELYMGDRYFYLPRVLLFWLIIWEFDSAARPVAWLARALCLAAVLLHLPNYVVPAPIDYHWDQHCDPIRRGIPAKIPILPEGWILEYRGHPRSGLGF